MNDRYVAYAGTYTHESSKGIHIYDMDVEKGRITERRLDKFSFRCKNLYFRALLRKVAEK